jgi:hypothetical protein
LTVNPRWGVEKLSEAVEAAERAAAASGNTGNDTQTGGQDQGAGGSSGDEF